MKTGKIELGLTFLVILYIAFVGRRPPLHLQDFVSSSVGSIITLLAVLYVLAYQSLLLGVFLGIAYIVTVQNVTEYLDEKEQKPEQPKSNSVTPSATGVLKGLMEHAKSPSFKGDSKLPAVTQKKGQSVEKPVETNSVKPTPPKNAEHYMNFY